MDRWVTKKDLSTLEVSNWENRIHDRNRLVNGDGGDQNSYGIIKPKKKKNLQFYTHYDNTIYV